ncbi:uncharacterized protein MONBRDRAFT_34039 [Monosiga brevicollis MX1]|uniref:AD domain-containing protein n=1 Tax=Monosiga brevicollis TaxID=81824 RepID=A9V9I3_MONBE|nr:uncharacterized protein MONBRDRAFT_34039 [Monosiga brevicollis MX1]EDQ85869.1 predicted protein [Monosiga brevicollis MX1]|eukprot:XP_001749348.1 hypothetical protein [Monosiga brevicollis MX1]
MNKRIRAAVQDAQRQLQSYSETASDDARAVFQAMTKLGKCQWHANDAILFNHMVLISAPYTSKNVKPVNKDGQDMATYVAERVAQLRK